MPNSGTEASFHLSCPGDTLQLGFSGDWAMGRPVPGFPALQSELDAQGGNAETLSLCGQELGQWDSLFMARLVQCANWCREQGVTLDSSRLPEGARNLLDIATAVKPAEQTRRTPGSWRRLVDGLSWFGNETAEFCHFIGATVLAMLALFTGRSNTRARDVFYFIDQVGPQALGIVTLLSVLVGMILAYMGAIQLRQFGAEIYVADLVAIGMVREMGVLMTGIIMAGRTGAAYAAQLGTMQTNEEIDALETLGISPMEFLVTPRMLALVLVMPLLVVYADMLGILGGAAVGIGLGLSPLQYFTEVQGAITWTDIGSGLIKSVIFATLVAIAGCQAGLQCGRSSEAVGLATTSAVVRAIVYLVVADSLLNVIYDKVGI